MAQEKASSLADFGFDDNETFFGIGETTDKTDVATIVKTVKKEDPKEIEDDLEDDGKTTSIGEDGKLR